VKRQDKRKQGQLNRRRGKDTQREHARLYCELWGVDPGYCAHWTQTEPDNVFQHCPGEGYYVSVKAEATWKLREYIRDAEGRADGRPWWIGIRRPRVNWQAYGSTWYALTRGLVYVRAITGWHDMSRFGDAIRARDAVMDFVEGGRPWRMGSAIPALEDLGLSSTRPLRWVLLLEAPPTDGKWEYESEYYALMAAAEWAEILEEAWAPRQEAEDQ
jgi:hypothetical protein